MGLREQWLVWRLRRRDESAAKELIERYHAGIFAYLIHLGAAPETAEDLTQETYAKVWQQIDRLRRPDSLRSWVYRIARNELLQSARRGEPSTRELDEADALPDPAPGALESLSTEQESLDIRQAVALLEPDLREAVTLHYLQDLSLREVSEVLATPVGTIKSRIHRALEQLRVRPPKETSNVTARSRTATAER